MSTCSIPQKVTVIVHSAKGLKPKNKGKHKFSVIFGVGGNKYRTDVVENLFDNPVFNTESEIEVGDPSLPLLLTVTEKQEKDVLGQVTIALSDLTHSRTNRPLTVPLRPHKKCPNPEGQLLMEAWISAATVGPPPAISVTSADGESSKNGVTAGLKKLKDRMSHSPILGRKSLDQKEHRRSHSDFNTLPRSSLSCHDLTSTSSYSAGARSENRHLKIIPTDSLSSLDSISETGTAASVSTKPEVSGISPNEGPVEGGTKVTIRGTNLGLNREDVIGLFFCGANVLGSMEYISSSKLSCVTKAWKACIGNVTVETQSGGKGLSLVQFAFVSRDQASDSASEVSSLSRSSSRGDADLKRSDSNRSDRGKPQSAAASEPVGLARNLKAKSMFDLSLMTKSQRPEITGISPSEAQSDAVTKLTIRGMNLGTSSADINQLLVCGIDCLSSVEYESSSKIFCYIGPAKAATGNIVIETVSGGRSSSVVKFSLVESRDDDSSSWAAVPYTEQDSDHVSGGGRSSDALSVNDQRGLSTGKNGRVSQSNGPSPGKLVVEIQPMRMDKKPSSSPFRAWKGKKTDKEKGLSEIPDKADANYEMVSENINNEWTGRRINELERELNLSEDHVKKLQMENKTLKEEVERIRRYMEKLVNQAIIRCPDILCVDGKI